MIPPATAVLCFEIVGSVSSLAAALVVSAIKGSVVIFSEPLTRMKARDDLLPSIHVDIFQGTQILHYIQSSNSHQPRVTIFPTKTVLGKSPAPSVAYFSSRGPSTLIPGILKPDISAPGVGILAAWPPTIPPTMLPPITDPRSVHWNFLSGTSMSCPHVTGVVAVLKSIHPDWSPAVIKSALMTTAMNIDATGDTILAQGTMQGSTPFDVGAGSINPSEAFDPGLVYDIDKKDYFGNSTVDLNYPSITITELKLGSPVRVRRTVQNACGGTVAEYRASIVSPNGVRVTVRPKRLVFFGFEGETVDYYVMFRAVKWSSRRFDFGEIIWSDGFHRVRSPLVVRVV